MQKTYQETLLVRECDCDRFGQMRPDLLFFAMQAGGEVHAKALGVGYEEMISRGFFFVLSRVHVHIDRMPKSGERMIHTTWPGTCSKFFFPRFHTFTLEDGTPLVSAGALWVLLDIENRRIVSPKTAALPFPDNSDIPDATTLPLRIPAVCTPDRAFSRTPVYSEFDVNGHVNNTKYIAWVCDALGSSVLGSETIEDLTVSYEKEIREESPLTMTLGREEERFSFSVVSDDAGKHFFAAGTLRKEDTP